MLRFLFGIIVVFFLGMLYWSSLLQEEALQAMRVEIETLRTQERAPSLATTPHVTPATTVPSAFANILTSDPYYEKTLPAQLGPSFIPQGTIRASIYGKPSNINPFAGWVHTTEWWRYILPTTGNSHFGIFETYAPSLAQRIEERPRKNYPGAPEFWVFLRDDIFWQPLEQKWFPDRLTLAPWFLQSYPVTSADFKFFYDVAMNAAISDLGAMGLRTYLGGIEEIEIVDEKTFIIRWKPHPFLQPDGTTVYRNKYIAKIWTASFTPLPKWLYSRFADGHPILEDEAIDSFRTSTIFAQNWMQHWARNIMVGCGPWLFNGYTEREIRFKRNPRYFSPLSSLTEEKTIFIRGAQEATWQDFKAGSVDLFEIPPRQVLDLEDFLASADYKKQQAKGDTIHRLDYLDGAFNYVGWNNARFPFDNANVRKAMTLAIDRNRIIHTILNDLAVHITVPFAPFSPAYNKALQPLPFDPEKSRQILAEEGWFDQDGDGILDKEVNGKRVPFRFQLLYFIKNENSKAICEYITTALRQMGIECQLNGVDHADLSKNIEDKSFDALFLAWGASSPPEDPRQIWHSETISLKGSSNHVSFRNKEVDKLIEELDFESDTRKRALLYHRIGQILYDEQPYTLLYASKTIFLYRDRVQNVFIPADRQDLIPGANVPSPASQVMWLR